MFVLLHCVLCHRANVLLLVLLHCEDSPVRILPWIEPLPRESIDRDYDGHWLAQTLRARSSSLSAKRSSASTGRLWEGRTSSGSAGLEWKLSLVPAQARAGASMFPFPGLRMFLAAVGANLPVLALAITLRVLGFDFVARLLIMSQRQLIRQTARYWSQPTSEGQFPFPLALEFWGSWTNS
jgi:hypothetical protein